MKRLSSLLLLPVALMQCFTLSRLYHHHQELEVFSRYILQFATENKDIASDTNQRVQDVENKLLEARYLLAHIWYRAYWLTCNEVIHMDPDDCRNGVADILTKKEIERIDCEIVNIVFGDCDEE